MKITPSQIIEYLFCPRFTYFEYVLRIPQKEDKYFKVMKGRDIHKKQSETNKKYMRKKPIGEPTNKTQGETDHNAAKKVK